MQQQIMFKQKLLVTHQGELTLTQVPQLELSTVVAHIKSAHLIRLDEINAQGHQAYRQALANVYSALDPHEPARLIYLLDSQHDGVSLYFGMVTDTEMDSFEAMKNLRGALEGQLPGINFGKEFVESDPSELTADNEKLLARVNNAQYQGVMLGAPTGQEADQADAETSFQGIDRLVRSLNACEWQLTVISQPITRQQIREQLDDAFALSSQLAARVRTSVQSGLNTSSQKTETINKNYSKSNNEGESSTRGSSQGGTETKNQGASTSNRNANSSSSKDTNSGSSQAKNFGTNESKTTNTGLSSSRSEGKSISQATTSGDSIGVTHEIADKQAQHLMDYLDKQVITRLQKGLTKGMF